MIATVAFALLAATPCEPNWPLWNRYVGTFISGDGRVIDRTAGDRTTSEGQAYALFFSLVANDRALFQRLLAWTEQNLAQRDLARNLPAWHWGKRKDGSWGVIDANSASDADLWLAYDLLEAGRLWSQPRYAALGQRLLANVAAREVASVPQLGTVLIPGANGFNLEGGFRVNPSYSPPQILRRFARLGAPWGAVLQSSMEMLRLFVPAGAVPDWAFAKAGQLLHDPVTGRVGSYDAIRVYLWIGMMPERDPGLDRIAAGLLRNLQETMRARSRLVGRRRPASTRRCCRSRLPMPVPPWRSIWPERSSAGSTAIRPLTTTRTWSCSRRASPSRATASAPTARSRLPGRPDASGARADHRLRGDRLRGSGGRSAGRSRPQRLVLAGARPIRQGGRCLEAGAGGCAG